MDQVLELLAQELAPDDCPQLIPAPVDRWVASSGLQKGIRRGDERTSLSCAKTLLVSDPERLWRRLCGIALEDIGIADLEAVAQVLAVAGQKMWRRQHGGEEYVAAYLVKKLCRGPKERSTDDLLAIADWHPAWEGERRRQFSKTLGELLDLVTDERQPLALRGMAAWYAAGTDRLLRYRICPRRGDPKAVLAIYRELGAPQAILELARVGLNRTRSALAIMLPLVWLAAQGAPVAIACTAPPGSPDAGGVPAYVLDGFSRTGRRALKGFVDACPAVAAFIAEHAPLGDPLKVLAMIVFHVEGGLLDRRRTWPGSHEVMHEGRIADIAGPGLSVDRIDEAMALVREHLPVLHQARVGALAQSQFQPSLPL